MGWICFNLRGRCGVGVGGKTGPQNPPLGWPNATGASPCCGALLWCGEGSAIFSLCPFSPGHCEMGALSQLRRPSGSRGGLTCHQGAAKAPAGGGPWASGPWNWPQTRLASKGTPATEITAKPRSPQRHVGHIFSMTKTAPNSGLFEGGKSPLPLPPTTTPDPTSIATHPQLPPPP